MYHRLLISRLVIAKTGVLLERLPNACHIAMTKNPKTTREKQLFRSIPLHVLIFQEGDDGLSHR
jgi:hypothetical protein